MPRGMLLTVTQLAEESGIARETVTKRLSGAGVTPAGKRGSYTVYRLRDALPAVLQLDSDNADPERLDPFKRRAYWQAENERLKHNEAQELLIPAAEVEATMARLFKTVVNAFEVAPDIVERDCGVSPDVIERLDRHFNTRRMEIYEQIVESEPEQLPETGA